MSEADYMWTSQISDLGSLDEYEPEYEVIRGKRQDVVFTGTRAECWDFKKHNGGFVRAYTGSIEEAGYE